MTSYDIVPDIHGQSAKLDLLLHRLGYRQSAGRWRHAEPDRRIVFLGDFIDRGPDNAGVLGTVRALIDSGLAAAVMGNHELNAVHFHNRDPGRGAPLRPHSRKNLDQHRSFLNEFPAGSRGARAWTDWMARLPLWLDLGPFRCVHACWSDAAIRRLERLAPGGVLPRERLLRAARPDDPLHDAVETLTKGPEVALPGGCRFTDKGGVPRRHMRVAWWRRGAGTWRDVAISVPDGADLPDGPLPRDLVVELYPRDAKPVFFGHYWLSGAPVLETPNALCLDFSAGHAHGPLVAYACRRDAPGLRVGAIVGHPDLADTAAP